MRSGAVLGAALVLCPGAAAAAKKTTRYSVAGGCYSLAPAQGADAPAALSQLRFQATDLGSYLLYTPEAEFVAAVGDAVATASEPSPAADWRVRGSAKRGFTLSPASAPDSALAAGAVGLALAARGAEGTTFRLVRADGCAVFPEAELNVKGRPGRGKTLFGEVRGVMDGHMHWMTFEYIGGNFHCGRPWHRYGIPAALPDCSSIEGPQGSAAPVQNFLNFGQPVAPHDTSGYPKLTEWRRDNLTYEGTYYRWLERAWKTGLKLIVMPINENRVLCELMPPNQRRNSCQEMVTVDTGIKDIKEMQRYVNAQAGGPGKGFFQIVRNPFQARKVINQGKMAVVLEIEISELFDCRGSVPESCSREIVDQGLEEMYRAGVRSSLLLNKFDNPLTGVRFDGGPIGALINAGNKNSYGSFWDAETCQGRKHDNEIEGGAVTDPALAALVNQASGGGATPTYPPAPHCNKRGLTQLGRHTVRRMIDLGMIINPDHMSQRGVDETISLAEARDYSGVISPHGWMDPRNWPRIWRLGGMAFPSAGNAEGYVDAWRTYRPKDTPHYFGWGYGADLGGLAAQAAPGPQGAPTTVSYPFKSIDGATTVRQQRTGDRTFDYPTEGVAHYGLYAEWFEEVRKTGGSPIKRDLLRGPEAYLQMWERAVGVPEERCQTHFQRFTRRGLGPLRLGMSSRQLLTRAGQPLHRTQAWTYCVNGKDNPHAGATAVLTRHGRVTLVAANASGQHALGIEPGESAEKVREVADAAGGGLWTAKLGDKTVAFVVSNGEVKTVAVAGGRAARSEASLRANLDRVPNRIDRRPPNVVGSPTANLSPQRAIPYVASGDGASPFPAYCGIQPS